ncbi:MAG TPA: hypothetical protein GX520_09245, partial [Syntrophaceticus sp.]|nr:hypothetical protein [Syntrophaceticus sp.]
SVSLMISFKLFFVGVYCIVRCVFCCYSLNEIIKDTERQVIEDVLRSHKGNITRAAESLGIVRQNLQYRMRKLGIKAQ